MKVTKISLLGFIAIVVWASSCTPKSEYTKKVEAELAKGIRYDSLFLGLSFGMTAKDFYAHCWELNRQGVFRQGSENMTVQYVVEETKYPALMDFYPEFHEAAICAMPVTFTYRDWAPWNKHLFADKLEAEIITLFEKWYGPGFMEVKHPEKEHIKVWVKVDGNRRIRIFQESDSKVKVIFTDLLSEKKQS
jgi:hypothetical protein